MVLRGQHHIFGTTTLKYLRPFRRLKHVGGKLRTKIRIFEILTIDTIVEFLCGGSTPHCCLMLAGLVTILSVPIPLCICATRRKCWHRIKTPVDEDAELRIGKPIRGFTGIQRLPSCFVINILSKASRGDDNTD